MLVGDVVIGWRSYVLWTGTKFFCIPVALLVMGSFGKSSNDYALDSECSRASGTAVAGGTLYDIHGSAQSALWIISNICSISANTLATTLAWYTFREYIRFSQNNNLDPEYRRRISSVQAFIVEGGTTFCVIQVRSQPPYCFQPRH